MRKRGLCCRLVSVRPSITLEYSIRTVEDVVKLLSPPGRHITLVFWSTAPIPNSKGTSSVMGGRKIHGGGKNLRFIYETVRDRPMVAIVLNAYRKSLYTLYRMMTCSMTFADPYPGFQGHSIFLCRISQKRFWSSAFTDKLLLKSNGKPYIIYRMVPFSMTLNDVWPIIQGYDIFEVEYLKNGAT